MSKYRKIDPRIWNDADFRILSDSGKLLFLFLLTHPHLTSLGAMRTTSQGLCQELQWKPEAFREAFRELFKKPLIYHDENSAFLWILNFLKYNQPESPNVIKSWVSSLDYIPECEGKYLLLNTVKAFAEGLPKAFAEALRKAFAEDFRKASLKPSPKPSLNHEQEQEQEQKEKEREGSPKKEKEKTKGKATHRTPEEWKPSETLLEWARKERPELNPEYELEKMRDTHFKIARSDWNATFRNWIRNANGNGRPPAPPPQQKKKVCPTCEGTGVIVHDGDLILPWKLEREVDQGLSPDICPDCRGRDRIKVPGLPNLRFPIL